MTRKSKRSNPWLVVVATVAIFLFYFLSTLVEPVSVSDTPILGTATTSSVPASNIKWYQVYFTSPKNPFDRVTEGGIEENLISLIDLSQTSIDAAFFEFDLENLSQAIIRAQERGVEIRLVYDDEHTNEDPQIGDMISSGIKAVPDDRSAYMHNKFVVIDNFCVWTGSFNYTINAAYKNNENAILICDEALAENYTTEFEEMYSGEFGRTSPSNTPNPVFNIGGIKIENYFAPEDDVVSQVIDEVSQATQTIHFMAFSFTDESLAQTMINSSESGVIVSGIFESRGAGASSSVCPMLFQNGIEVMTDGNPYTFHHKVIIIDSAVVIFGSFNFSGNANENNDENLLIVHDPLLAADFEAEFQRRKAESNSNINASCSGK